MKRRELRKSCKVAVRILICDVVREVHVVREDDVDDDVETRFFAVLCSSTGMEVRNTQYVAG